MRQKLGDTHSHFIRFKRTSFLTQSFIGGIVLIHQPADFIYGNFTLDVTTHGLQHVIGRCQSIYILKSNGSHPVADSVTLARLTLYEVFTVVFHNTNIIK